jgi:hypothetical protein
MDHLSDTELLIQSQLYKEVDLSSHNEDEIISLLEKIKNPIDTVDAYCVECKSISTFRGQQIDIIESSVEDSFVIKKIFGTHFECSRNNNHKIFCFFYLNKNNNFIKIGQYPSLADLNQREIGHYREILGEDKYKEISKAIGLHAHGVGIGAFVYLRRIFEHLLEEAHKIAKIEKDWDEEGYRNSKVDIKIKKLAKFLPSFLVSNSKLYAILSKGIHQLSENQCMEYFNVVKLGIFLVLDEKLEKLKKTKLETQCAKEISKITQEIKEM